MIPQPPPDRPAARSGRPPERIRQNAAACRKPPAWANPNVTRSRVVLEIAAELVAAPDQPLRQAKVLLREHVGVDDWPLCLFGSATIEGVRAVVAREAALGMINPSIALTLAYRGRGPFRNAPAGANAGRDPVGRRVRARRQSRDRSDVDRRHRNAKVSAARQHARHPRALAALHDRGHLRGRGFLDPRPAFVGRRRRACRRVPASRRTRAAGVGTRRFRRHVRRGDERVAGHGARRRVRAVAVGGSYRSHARSDRYRRATIAKERYPALAADVLTIDFSAWPIFVHADLPDRLVRQFCAALEARKHLIPWQGEGPLPIERMCGTDPEAPATSRFHPAAGRFWRERGFI